MRRIAGSGGFCAFHAVRMAAIGQSATVALIYLSVIEHCLPRIAARRDSRERLAPLLPVPNWCEACAQQQEVERRECFFLALLIRARGPQCYGAPALVCMRHLPILIEYIDEGSIGDILALHRDATATRKPDDAADTLLRVLLGPPPLHPRPPALSPDPDGSDIPDPVRRMRCRLRDLPSCAICAEIEDSRAEWLGWLARASEDWCKLSDVLPLCGDHVWRARAVAGPVRAPALAAVVLREAEKRLGFAVDAAAACSGSRQLIHRLGRMIGTAPARHAAVASLRRGRECPLCVRAREAGERGLSLVAALVESTDGRRAFENGHGLCVRHAARCDGNARPRIQCCRRADDPCPADAAALGTGGAASARRLASPAAAARRRIGGLAQGRRAFRRHNLADPVDDAASAQHVFGQIVGMEFPVTAPQG